MKQNIILIRNFLSKTNYYLKRIFLLPLHFGGTDYYPPVTHNTEKKTFLRRNFDFLNNKNRMKFWSYLARKHSTLKFFYSKSPEIEFEKVYSRGDTEYFDELKTFYKYGTATIDNFFNKNEHNKIIKYFQKHVHTQFSNLNLSASWLSNSKELNNLIHRNISTIDKVIFNKNIGIKKYRLSSWKKNKNYLSDKRDSVLFHQDRFLPSIKLIYFPLKVEIDPYEYCYGSHIINSQFYENSIKTMKGVLNVNNDYNYSNYEKKKFLVKENSLIITATHGLHRRSQTTENKSGIRDYITISYYNDFTRYDLFLNYLKSYLFR